MDPFCEKLLLLVVDKLLLAGAGALIAYVAAKALERYRRRQAVLLELGKIRAQAFSRILMGLGEQQLLTDRILGMERTAEGQQVLEHFEKLYRKSLEDVTMAVLREGMLLDDELRGPLGAYANALHDGIQLNDEKRAAGFTQEELKVRRERLSKLREQLMAYLPPLPKND